MASTSSSDSDINNVSAKETSVNVAHATDQNSLAAAFRLWAKSIALNTNVCMPAVVKSYDSYTNTAVVVPLVQNQVASSGENFDRAAVSVTVRKIFAGGMKIDLCVKEGDTGWVIASDRNSKLAKLVNQYISSSHTDTFDMKKEPQPVPDGSSETHLFETGFFLPDSYITWRQKFSNSEWTHNFELPWQFEVDEASGYGKAITDPYLTYYNSVNEKQTQMLNDTVAAITTYQQQGKEFHSGFYPLWKTQFVLTQDHGFVFMVNTYKGEDWDEKWPDIDKQVLIAADEKSVRISIKDPKDIENNLSSPGTYGSIVIDQNGIGIEGFDNGGVGGDFTPITDIAYDKTTRKIKYKKVVGLTFEGRFLRIPIVLDESGKLTTSAEKTDWITLCTLPEGTEEG